MRAVAGIGAVQRNDKQTQLGEEASVHVTTARHRRSALAILAALFALWLLLVTTGNGTPRGIDYTPHGTQPGLAMALLGSRSCGGCHAGTNVSERRSMAYSAWSGSMMANAARDPLFWAALDVANHDAPGSGDSCLRCHAPQAWLNGRVGKDASGATVDGSDGCLLRGDHDDLETPTNDFDGIGCHYCHRLLPESPDGGTSPIVHNADNWIDDSASCAGFPGPCRRGPYLYPDPGVAQPPPHGWASSAFHADSSLCGGCHEVSSPITSTGAVKTLLDESGIDTHQPFPLDRTYGEWRASDAGDRIFADGMAFGEPATDGRKHGVNCQECHMPTATGFDNFVARACVDNPSGSRRDRLPVHELAGGNTWIPQVIKSLYGGTGGLDRAEAFDNTSALALRNLQHGSATLDLTLEPGSSSDRLLSAHVRVTNRTAHKLPTGHVDARRMWLELEARDESGAVFWRSGHYDAETGQLDSRDSSAKVYEAIRGRWDKTLSRCVATDAGGNREYHALLDDCIVRDNRIPPLGFGGGSDPALRPVAYVYPETSPGSGRLVNYDDADYAIPRPAGDAQRVTLSVKLRYQSVTRSYVEFLAREATTQAFPSEDLLCADRRAPLTTGPRGQSRGAFMLDLWQAYGRSAPVTLQTAEQSLVLSPSVD